MSVGTLLECREQATSYDDVRAVLLRGAARTGRDQAGVNVAAYAGREDALEREKTGQTVLLRTADAAEGMRAFEERRPARFSGR